MQKNANAFRRECPPISVKSGALMPDIPQAIKKPERETRLVYPKRKAARQEPGISTTALSIVEVYRLLLQVENIHISSLTEPILTLGLLVMTLVLCAYLLGPLADIVNA